MTMLTVEEGGLGLRSAMMHCSAAYLYSLLESKSFLSHVIPSIDFLPALGAGGAMKHMSYALELKELMLEERLVGMSQKMIGQLVEKNLWSC